MLKIMELDAEDIRIPRRLYVQPQKRRRKSVRPVISAVMAVGGIILLCMTETAISCGIAGVACEGIALAALLTGRRTI